MRSLKQLLAIGSVMCALAVPLGTAAHAGDVLVFAAASTSRAVDAVIDAWRTSSGKRATASYAASGTLARQIVHGAPADIYISANPKWMTHVIEAGAVAEHSAKPLLSNRLVVIAPEGASVGALTGDSLAVLLDGERFAMGNPETAPVGRYGKAALTFLGLWDAVEPNLAITKDTWAAVTLVARREAALGLVYSSDAQDVEGITVVAELPVTSHPDILYLAAPVEGSRNAELAQSLLSYMRMPQAQAIFKTYGFSESPIVVAEEKEETAQW